MGTAPSPNRNWEDVFCTWGGPPSATEQTKCENAERAVRKAIDASAKLNTRSIEVFVQGSYANRTNVRQDSDVDICVLCDDVFFTDYTLSEAATDKVSGFQISASLLRAIARKQTLMLPRITSFRTLDQRLTEITCPQPESQL